MLGTNRLLLGVAVMAVAGCATETSTSELEQEGRVVEVVEGNPGCAEAAAALGRDLGDVEVKIEPPVPGTYPLDALNSVTWTSVDGVYLDWAATIGIDAVIVKGGPHANVYAYDPEAFADTGLSSPVTPGGPPAAISHVTFCFDYNVAVGKTAVPSFDRTYAWSIDKTGAADELTLAAGEVFPMAYTVQVARTGAVDSDWQVSGEIAIANPTPFEAHVVAVTDTLVGGAVAVTCPELLPFTIASGGAVTCTYAITLAGPMAGVNHVAVETVGLVGGGEASAAFDFVGAAPTERDACIAVTDDRAGVLGTACEEQTFEYTLAIGPYEACGASETFLNVASFVAADTGAYGADSWTVAVTIPPCELGCTLTQGYWKTHAGDRHPPFDDAWLALPAGPATPFFASGDSYLGVLWTPPRGNPYYVLAHQFIAAELNGANGASLAAVTVAMSDARAIFEAYTPADIAGLRHGATLPARMLKLAGVLDRYNNGLIGPGHCDEPLAEP